MLRRKFLQLLLMSTAPFIMGIPTVVSASGGGSGPGGSDGSSGGGSGPGGSDGSSGGGSGPGDNDGSSGGGSGPGDNDGSSGGGSGPGDSDGVAGASGPNDGVAGGSGYSGGISGSRAGDVSSQNGIVNDVESALDSDGMEAVDADDVANALAEFN